VNTGAVSEAVAKAEAELSAFWSAAKDEGGTPKARAATLNFVAVSGTAEVEALRAGIEDLAHTRAGRVLLMTVDGRLAPWELDIDVSPVCNKEGDTVVCYDRIELRFGAVAAARGASVLSALSLSEVPTIIEIGRGAPATLTDALVKGADRLIVDSAHTALTRIAEIARKTRAPLGDRAFVRTFSWREFVARFFDEAPGAERAIGRVEIERSTAEHRDPAALVLGWLGSRLGWRFESATLARDAEGMPVEILVRQPYGQELPPGELAAVRLTAAVDGRPLFCGCERKPGERVVRWSMSGPRAAVHDYAIGHRDEGWVLLKAIDSPEGDAVYRAAVVAGAEWIKLHEGASR
jgi:glucose-6-phosphate dehydrogenase assembly protein OpcA